MHVEKEDYNGEETRPQAEAGKENETVSQELPEVDY